MAYFPHAFDAAVTLHDVGSERYRYTVLFLPDDLKDDLPLKQFPRLRIAGEVNDHPFEGALTPTRGEWYLLLSKKFLAAIEARIGDEVSVRFRVADQDNVDVPPALSEALGENPDMKDLWDTLTSGKQRGLAYRVGSAKTEKTQTKRVTEVFEILTGVRDFRGKLK